MKIFENVWLFASKFVKFLISILKRQVNSSSNLASFFIVMIHNSSVNFKLMHFLLWIKGSHKTPNFETFKCSIENLPNSLCHFPNYKSFILQILHHSSVSWKITPLYFFRSNVIYFARKEPIKVEILKILSTQIKIHQNFVIFETANQLFKKILHHSSVSWDIKLLYTFSSWNFIYFQQKESIKVKLRWNVTWAVGSLKFCTFMGSFCSNHIKFQQKIVQKSYLSWQ